MENKLLIYNKNLFLKKILWVLFVTASGAALGYIFTNITSFAIGGLIGGSFVFFYKKSK